MKKAVRENVKMALTMGCLFSMLKGSRVSQEKMVVLRRSGVR
jgi:hypothetical protein